MFCSENFSLLLKVQASFFILGDSRSYSVFVLSSLFLEDL